MIDLPQNRTRIESRKVIESAKVQTRAAAIGRDMRQRSAYRIRRDLRHHTRPRCPAWNENCRVSGVRHEHPRHPKIITLLAVGVVATGVAGNALLRAGLSSAPPILSLSPFDYIKQFANVLVLLGVISLVANLILQLSLLSWTDLSYALPVTSASYGVITMVGVFGLHEEVSIAHWAGVGLILFGVIIVGRTKPLTTHAEAAD